jgi:hypothetical protein
VDRVTRRSFFGLLVGGVAVAAAGRAWLFRVYSFASEPEVIESWDVQGAHLFVPDQWVNFYGMSGGLPKGRAQILSVVGRKLTFAKPISREIGIGDLIFGGVS